MGLCWFIIGFACGLICLVVVWLLILVCLFACCYCACFGCVDFTGWSWLVVLFFGLFAKILLLLGYCVLAIGVMVVYCAVGGLSLLFA